MTFHQHTAAGIDLGSNTFRLLIAGCSTKSLLVLAKKLETVRLGRGLKENGLLQNGAMQKGFSVLQTFREILDWHQPHFIRICGTEALRQAQNNQLFLQKAEEILQGSIHILNGEEEARLSLAGALSGKRKLLSTPLLLVDVGGGSTELVFTEPCTENIRAVSLPLGAVWLTERFFTEPQPNFASLDSLLTETLYSSLEKLKLLKKNRPITIIGCGGTATSLAALQLGLPSYNESLVHGHVLQSSAIQELWAKLTALPAGKRNELPCLGEGRGEILPAGIRIFQLLLKLLQQDQMQVSDTGLLEGILLSSITCEDCSHYYWAQGLADRV
jgi:exopolyphosphatase/guanosine-5'-triphosphate,3'-diphosphate pyrophosphatase